MLKLFTIILALTTTCLTSFSNDRIKSFAESGVIVDINSFFKEIKEKPAKILFANTSGKAFVTKTGVYAFIESPENDNALKGIKPGSHVAIKGKVITDSFLLHIDLLILKKEKSSLKTAKIENIKGQEIKLSGVNKCQCGLTLDTIPHSCKLGHIHHLETDNKVIYHYLQSSKLHSLNKNHFKKLKIKAKLYPGNWIYIEEIN